MPMICEICGKRPFFGMSVSHSHRREKKRFNPNIQKIRVLSGSSTKRMYVCTSCIKANKVVKPAKSLS